MLPESYLRDPSNSLSPLYIISKEPATVVCCIVVLGAIAAITRDYKSLENHVNGMQKIIALRGGYDKLGWDGYVAARSRQ
jgi:hypothetical protein